MSTIPKLVITGGPCAGKTSAMAHLSEWLTERGYYSLIVPEPATILIGGGMNPALPEFQQSVMQFSLSTEANFVGAAESLANSGHKPVLLCDRGLWDQVAYMNRSSFEMLCYINDINPIEARDQRYTGVLFLRTAADGAEEFYTTANNEARRETLEEARAIDAKTLQAWVGTPALKVIENESGKSFADKMQAATAALASMLGEPEPVVYSKRYLVDILDQSQLAKAEPIDIVQTYLVGTKGRDERVRARGQYDNWVYTHTVKTPHKKGGDVVTQRIITRREYENLLVRRDLSRAPVIKVRHCFASDGQYCELDVPTGQLKNTVLLQIGVTSPEVAVTIPAWLHVRYDVTNNHAYRFARLAEQAA